MTTHIALVVCVKCGVPRPVTCRWPHEFREAEQRPCRECARKARKCENPAILAWNAAQSEVDEVAVQRLLSGSRVRATRAERQAAVSYLVDHRVPNAVIAQRIHATKRTVERLRQRMRTEAG